MEICVPKTRNSNAWQPKAGEILFAVLLSIIPWSFPTVGITARCISWVVAWAMVLHLLFSLVPWLSQASTFAKVSLVIVATALGSTLAYRPVVDTWRDERASVLTGRLYPTRDGKKHIDVMFQIGPDAASQFEWTGVKDTMQWGSLGSFVMLRRNDSGDLVADTIIRDHSGNVIVEINDNEWRISNAAWEKNYTDDSLEVKDARGRIIFQIRLLADHAEFQAEWWDEYGNGLRVCQTPDDPSHPPPPGKHFFGIVKMDRDHHPDEPSIQPIFAYPSKKRFGELR